MTATEDLRRLLDERGVEFDKASTSLAIATFWSDSDGNPCSALDGADDIPQGKLSVQLLITPQQAIDATLGPEHTFTREDVEGAFVSGYSLGTLPVGSDPQWDENRQTVDEHMAELGWIRADATLGRGECHDTWDVELTGRLRFQCSECEAVSLEIAPRFCPVCGRRVVDA